jgi:hypothetical protein
VERLCYRNGYRPRTLTSSSRSGWLRWMLLPLSRPPSWRRHADRWHRPGPAGPAGNPQSAPFRRHHHQPDLPFRGLKAVLALASWPAGTGLP